MKKILVINLGWEQEPLLDLIGSQDFLVYGVHFNDDYYKGIIYRDILISDLRNIKRILQFADKIKPDAVISDQCDYSQFAQAIIAERFGLPGPKIRDAQIGNNKYLQRELGTASDILCPPFSLCLDVSDALNFADHYGYPIVTKPVDNRGSSGVNRVDNKHEVKESFLDALVNSNSRTVLAEKYIEGTHITVDGYVFKKFGPKALAVATKKKLKQKRSIIDGEITYPGELSTQLYTKVIETFESMAKAYGFSFGFLHGEFIIDNSENVYLTEIANRGGGVFTSEVIVPNVSGIDVNSLYLNDCIGTNIIQLEYHPDNLEKIPTIMKLFAFSDIREGIVKGIDGVDALEKHNDVLKLKMLIHKGDVVHSISSGADRHGVIIMTGSDLQLLKKRLNESISNLEVRIEEH